MRELKFAYRKRNVTAKMTAVCDGMDRRSYRSLELLLMSQPPVPTPRSTSPATREFTEKWLQALSRSATFPEAQQVRPLLFAIDRLSSLDGEGTAEEAADKLWKFCLERGLTGLLQLTPFRSSTWRFEGDEDFNYERLEEAAIDRLDLWKESLGIADTSLPMTGIVHHDDWTRWLRDEAIRLRKPLNVASIPKETTHWLGCRLSWCERQWRVDFDEPNWLSKTYSVPFTTDRPSLESVIDCFVAAMRTVDARLVKLKPASGGESQASTTWEDSLPALKALHERALRSNQHAFSPWFRRIWNAVWPVVYREQARLRGACDLDVLRAELEQCFRAAGDATLTVFVLAKLICVHRLRSGLGILGGFED